MSRVLLKNVSKVFDGGLCAVNNVSLEINDKEFMVIVGPSGCGKTTTLRMIAGLEEVTEGTITIGDTVVNDTPPKDRDIAMVFQNYALYPHMTVFENMAFALKLRRYARIEIEKRVSEAAAMLGIDKLLDRKPRALSGGQRQRVALGRAIVRNPRAFLFDEPLSNLDARLRVATRAELKVLHQRLQTTSIYVTHDQAEAMTLGDRICIMRQGVVQQVARPMEVYDHPVNRFVAGFLGTPPMNFFYGRITTCNSVPCFGFGKCLIRLPEQLWGAVSQYNEQEMVMGVRPEDLFCRSADSDSNPSISATVQVVEPLGDKQEVYLKAEGNHTFVVSLSPHTGVHVDDHLEISLKPERIHLFESGETGRNIMF